MSRPAAAPCQGDAFECGNSACSVPKSPEEHRTEHPAGLCSMCTKWAGNGGLCVGPDRSLFEGASPEGSE